MAARDRQFFQQGINMYVKAMQFSADMIQLEPQSFNCGTPAANNPTKYATGLNAQAAANTIFAVSPVGIADATYGRIISYTPSGVPGNANQINVYGQDYLGQPMVEQITGSAAASSTINGKKAFYRVLSAKIITPSTNPITFSIGTGGLLGFPYKGVVAFTREAGATITTGITTTLADLTDPATATTGDPRGTWFPQATPNGAIKYELEMFGDNSVNAAGNGGLLGIQQFYG